MPLRFRHIARNVLSNWFATAANMAIGFFLAPFIVHRLGNTAYGVWVLAISSVNYLTLLDLGMRSSVLRFVSKGHTVGDHQGASDALSGALWVRLQISGLVLLLSGVLAFCFSALFKVPPELVHDARIAVMIIGVTTSVTMSMGVFGGVLSALNRYDLQSVVTLVQLAFRVAGVVFVLRSGRGIVAIALCELVAALVGNLLLVFIARRIYPQLHISFARPKPGVLRALWSYSVYAFLTSVAIQLVYQTDNLVVGTFVSAAAVTFYSIGNSLCRYTDQCVGAMSVTFVPAASSYDASGDVLGLQKLYWTGTRMTLALALPILISLIIRGRTFIGLWMGPEYAREGGNVLMILAFPLMISYANRTAVAIAFGVGKHKKAAIWAMVEGVANLVLSVLLVHRFGIYGVAFGTLIPNILIGVLVWPGYVSDLIGIKASTVILQVWSPMLLTGIPFAAASYAVERLFPVRNMLVFFLQTFALLPVFLATVAILYREKLAGQLMPRVRAFFYAQAQ